MNRPWMPLYIADYRSDTAHLSAAQHGAYLLLIMHYWTTGGLPVEDAPLARIAGMSPTEWKKNRATVAAFFTSEWKHKRIDTELAKASDISSKRRASAEQRHSKSNANAQRLDTHARTCASALPSQSQSEEDAASAASAKTYAFQSGILRLTEKDFVNWQAAFSHLDLRGELVALAPWAEQQGPTRWFHAVANALNKRNREVKKAKDQGKTEPAFKWNGIEGVI